MQYMSVNNSHRDIRLKVECWLDSPAEAVEINIGALAQHLDLSVRTLRRRLADRQTNFSAIVKNWRIAKAKHMLKQPDLNIGSIAQRLGYTYTSNFERAFKRWTGISPGEYRKQR